MKSLTSFIRENSSNISVSVSASSSSGLPKVTLVGIRDSESREVLIRLRVALEMQGFEWSLKRHVILSVEGAEQKNYDRWLDLPLALCFLKETGQLQFSSSQKILVCGPLNLEGEVEALNLEESGLSPEGEFLWVGNLQSKSRPLCESLSIKKLSDFNKIKKTVKRKPQPKMEFRDLPKEVIYLKKDFMEIFEVLIHGEHSAVFLGVETTDFKRLGNLVQESLLDLSPERKKNVRHQKTKRPLVSLEVSHTKSQIIGSRHHHGLSYYVHGGVLLCNNFFNFSRSAKEALQSLLIEETFSQKAPLGVVLLAKNVLCPCGKARVGQPRKCGYSYYKCRSVVERFSCEALQLFQMVLAPEKGLFDLYPAPEHSLEELQKRRKKASWLQKSRGQEKPNSQLSLMELKNLMSKEAKTLSYLPQAGGLERNQAVLSVARTLADLDGEEFIGSQHVERSLKLSYKVAREVVNLF